MAGAAEDGVGYIAQTRRFALVVEHRLDAAMFRLREGDDRQRWPAVIVAGMIIALRRNSDRLIAGTENEVVDRRHRCVNNADVEAVRYIAGAVVPGEAVDGQDADGEGLDGVNASSPR